MVDWNERMDGGGEGKVEVALAELGVVEEAVELGEVIA